MNESAASDIDLLFFFRERVIFLAAPGTARRSHLSTVLTTDWLNCQVPERLAINRAL